MDCRKSGGRDRLFNFGIGSHHEGQAPESNWEHSIEHQILAWNSELMERLWLTGELYKKGYVSSPF